MDRKILVKNFLFFMENGFKYFIAMAMAGNKIDLIEKEKVTFSEASAFAKVIRFFF